MAARWQSDNPFERIWGTQNIPKDRYVRSMSNSVTGNYPNLNYRSGGSNSSAFKNLSNMMPGSGESFEEYERQRQLALAKRAQQSQPSYADQMNQGTVSLTPQQFAGYTNSLIETQEGEPTWWDTAGDLIGASGPLGGLKGWLDLGVKGLGAYAGLQQVGAAKDQNRLARDAFTFQKAAWNKDYDARKIAYNTNAQMRNDWKAAQTPGGYTMDALIA